MTTASTCKRADAHSNEERRRTRNVPYTMRLPDGRIVFIEMPARMARRERTGELTFTPDGVRLLDSVRALAWEGGPAPSPAYLASLREAMGLTQAQLGRLIGRNKLTVSRWERGRLSPGTKAIGRLYELARKRKRAGVVLAG
jgi:hypothetical protein